MWAGIDIHKHVFQAVVLDAESGVASEDRFEATPLELARWVQGDLTGEQCVVAIEATTGGRWVHRELRALGIDVRLAEPVQTRALRGRRRGASRRLQVFPHQGGTRGPFLVQSQGGPVPLSGTFVPRRIGALVQAKART